MEQVRKVVTRLLGKSSGDEIDDEDDIFEEEPQSEEQGEQPQEQPQDEEVAEALWSGLIAVDEGAEIPIKTILKHREMFPLSEEEVRRVLDYLAQQGRVVLTDDKVRIVYPEE